ncbi:hypothetical protein ACA910_016597 [Epithemia clementina (nom. ined.)]
MSSSTLQHPLYAALEYLKELNLEEDYWFGLESMGRLLENVKNNPLDERFRRFQVDDPFFNSRIGCMIGSEKLMLAAGFLIDEVNGKEFYYMHATAEAWEELLTVSAIMQNVLKDKDKTPIKALERMPSRGRNIERMPSRDKSIERMAHRSRSGSRTPLPKSSSTHSSKRSLVKSNSTHSGNNSSGESLVYNMKSPHSRKGKVSRHSTANRRGSNGDSTVPSMNDSGDSFFMDEGDFGMASDSGMTSEDNEKSSTPKKKKKKKKKKQTESSSSAASDRAHEEISKAGGKMDSDGKSKSSSAERESKAGKNGSESGKEPKRKKKKSSSTSARSPSPGKTKSKKALTKTGSTSSISSSSSLDERLNKSKESLNGSGVVASTEADGAAKTATKDFWKNANTQAFVAHRVKTEESSGKRNWGLLKNATLGKSRFKLGTLEGLEGGSNEHNEGDRGSKRNFGKMISSRVLGTLRSSDDEGESDADKGISTDDDKEVNSTATGKRGGFKIDSMHKLRDGSKKGSKMGLTDKTASIRSMGSSSAKSKTSSRPSRKLERNGSSRVSMRDLERGLSLSEIIELREMAEEKRQLREMRKKRLLEKIKKATGPRWTVLMMSVSLVRVAELGLDLGTTVISFVSLIESFDCCGNVIDAGGLTMGITIPYFVLIVAEMVFLGLEVKHARGNSAWDAERLRRIDDENDDLEFFDDEDSFDSEDDDDEHHDRDEEERLCSCSKFVSLLILANPFLGCLISWVLLYEVSSKNDAFLILFLEAGSVVLMFLALYLERATLNFCSMVVHGIPLLPFAATVFVVWYYLEKGGICFRDGNFWFDGCGLCAHNTPSPPDGGPCPNGTLPYQGTYCGHVVEEQFCYFSY